VQAQQLTSPAHTAPGDASAVLDALASGEPVSGRTVMVVAHPDDETLSLGLALPSFEHLTLVHVTDGAPLDGDDAAKLGFHSLDHYREAREAELAGALAHLAPRCRRIALGVADQTAVRSLAAIVERLGPLLQGADRVVTHPYEGGHPDHDAVALAVQRACQRLTQQGRRAPLRLEFAGYYKGPDGQITGRFHPDPDHPAVEATPSAARLAVKRAAVASFVSQAGVTRWFDPTLEAYRTAPDYDFTQPPPPGRVLYDDWGWALTSARWRVLATEALRS
jgi:N-acetylglucosamine malate deacetylase 2